MDTKPRYESSRRLRQLTDLSHCPEEPPLSELSLMFPESTLHLKSLISRMNHFEKLFLKNLSLWTFEDTTLYFKKEKRIDELRSLSFQDDINSNATIRRKI